jgi:predicted RNA-binding Zn ribbon-like protein
MPSIVTCQLFMNGKVSLVEPLNLDAGNYAGTYKLLGGRLALDFLNTVSWPGHERGHDWFESSKNVTAWLAAVGLGRVTISEALRAQAIQIRATLDTVIRPLANGTTPTSTAVTALSQLARGALSRRHIDPKTLQWTADRDAVPGHPFDPIVLDAAELVVTPPGDRLRYCPSCDWLFEDHSRNGQRRWCDMTDCGARHKARTYYHRSRTDPAP